jgi:ribosomal protein S8
MSLVNLANVCSHLQNCSKVRLGTTSILLSKPHLSLCLALQKEGLISTVQVGGIWPPAPPRIAPESREQLAAELKEEPWAAYPLPAARAEPDRPAPKLPRNAAERRIWLGLKYWKNVPVLSRMNVVSKPSRPIKVSFADIQRLVRGFRAGYVDGLKNPGECLFVQTELGILESRECLERRVGGLALCRAL